MLAACRLISHTLMTLPLDSLPAAGALTPADVDEFNGLLRKHCETQLAPDVVARRASQLVTLYRALMGPLPEEAMVQTSPHVPPAAVDNNSVVEF